LLKHLSEMQKAAVYTALVFVFVIVLVMLPGEKNTSVFMFVPMASVLITMLLTGEGVRKQGWAQLGFHRFHMRGFLLALAVPIIPIIIGYAAVWISGLGAFGLSAEYEGQGMFLFVGFFVSFVINAFTVTLGEEIGWRGYLAEKLAKLGFAQSLLLNGFIWGLFHLPIMLFTDVYHDDANMVLYIPLFMATVTLVGAFITYLKYVTGSIWPAIAAHTVHNLVWYYGELFTQEPNSSVTYITGDAGIVLLFFYLIVFIIIMKRNNKEIRERN